jgi:protein O-mannosyl-transferase
MAAAAPRGFGAWWLAALFVLPAAVLLVHVPTFDSYVFEDDVGWMLDGRAWTLADVFRIEGRSHFYRPMVGLHFVVFAGWLGGSPALLHAVNVALHAVNALLVFGLARRLGLSGAAAFTSGLLMAVLTRSAESVAWISGVSAVLLTTFFLLALVLHARVDGRRRAADRVLELVCFAATLLTHEAGVTLLPVLLLLDWTLRPPEPGGWRARGRAAVATFWPHAGLTAAYLVVSYLVNRANYVVTERHYEVGWHVVDSLARYLVSLHVGRPDAWSLVLTPLAVLAGLWWGRPVLRFGLAWMMVTLLPYCFFTWGLTGRYLYLPGAGFALALGSLVPRGEGRPKWVRAAAAIVVTAVAVRFAVFGAKTARDYRARTASYRAYVERSRARYPLLARGAVIEVPAPAPDEPGAGILESLLRLAYDDPTLRVMVAEKPPAHR